MTNSHGSQSDGWSSITAFVVFEAAMVSGVLVEQRRFPKCFDSILVLSNNGGYRSASMVFQGISRITKVSEVLQQYSGSVE
jgi:hypothetical protein